MSVEVRQANPLILKGWDFSQISAKSVENKEATQPKTLYQIGYVLPTFGEPIINPKIEIVCEK